MSYDYVLYEPGFVNIFVSMLHFKDEFSVILKQPVPVHFSMLWILLLL